MRTGPAVRPVAAPTTPPPIPTTTPEPADGGVVVVITPDTNVIKPGETSDGEGPPRNLECWDVPWNVDGKEEMVLKTCRFSQKLCSYTVDYQGVLKAYGCADKDWIDTDSENYNETSVSATIDIPQ